MNDTPPAESKPPGPVPADDPGRVLTHVSPDTDDSLPHLGVVGDTYTILVSGADTAGRYTFPCGRAGAPSKTVSARENQHRAWMRDQRFGSRA